MASSVTLKALGLNISQNQLEAPPGSLLEASNVIIRRESVIEPRRGIKLYGSMFGTAGDRAKQLFTYRNTILFHYANKLAFDSDGNGTPLLFDGSYVEPIDGLRIKSTVQNGNFYFTTTDGIKKISAKSNSEFTTSPGYITDAGIPKALDITATLNTRPTSGNAWFSTDSVVAYKVVWGLKDRNDNLLLGSPSEQTIIYNPLLQSIIKDYINVLGALDDIEDSSLITDGDYVSTFVGAPAGITYTSTANEVRNSIIAMTAKLDNDIFLADNVGSPTEPPLQIVNISFLPSNIVQIDFDLLGPSVLDYLKTADTINIRDFVLSSAPETINGTQTVDVVVNSVTQNYIQFTNPTTLTSPTVTTYGEIYSGIFTAITPQPASEIGSLPTHDELAGLQSYLDSIILTLQGLPVGIIDSTAQTNIVTPLDITTELTTTLRISIPENITTAHFFQIHRTGLLTATGAGVLSDLTPPNEFFQVYEANPTTDELQDGFVIVDDINTDSFFGPPLYTNSNSGEGLLQANDLPPYCTDINKFKGYVFYSDTKRRHSKTLQLLGVSSILDEYLNSNNPTITVTNEDNELDNYEFQTGTYEEFDVVTLAKASIPSSSYFIFNSAQDINEYAAWYDVTGTDTAPTVPGRVLIRIDVSDAGIVTDAQVADKTVDILSRYIDDFSVSNIGNTVTVICNVIGSTADAQDVNTGFTILTTVQGRSESALRQVTEITTVADVAGSLAGKYFLLNDVNNIDKYYIWYTVNFAGIDPSISGRTGIQVNVALNSTAAQVASSTASSLNTSNPTLITAESTGSTLTLTHFRYGKTDNVVDGNTTFTFNTTVQGELKVYLSESPSAGTAVDDTVRSLVRVMNLNRTGIISAYNIFSINGLPGSFQLESKDIGDARFFITTNLEDVGDSFQPSIKPRIFIQSVTLPNIVQTVDPHELITGDFIVVSGTDTDPILDGYHQVTVTGADTFTVNSIVLTSVGTNIGGITYSEEAVFSDNEVKHNRLYYSKYQQPEAVPILNYIDIGSSDKAINRIMPLRDSLFVFKEDGLYRVSGEIAPFNTSLFDETVKLRAPDSLSPTNNVLFCWSTQGITTVSEGGVSLVSRPIDIATLKVQSFDNFFTKTVGVGYDSDNSYTVYTLTKASDEETTIGYRYNSLTSSWTTIAKGATCGLVADFNDKLYLGAPDVNSLEIERKTFTRKDYADREIIKQISPYTYINSKIFFASIVGLDAGDVITQDQTVTPYAFNMLLKKMDNDSVLTDLNYSSSLTVGNGDNLSSQLDLLIAKVRDDAGRTGTVGSTPSGSYTALIPVANDFESLETAYNDFIDLINNDPGVGFSNYASSEGITSVETVITNVDVTQKKITLTYPVQFVQGPVTIYKAISSSIVWTPHNFGDPLNLKQIYETTLMVDSRTFTSATLSFATDLKPGFESVTFDGSGSGGFGISNPFGENYFGGGSNSAPLRTTIPRDRQRCRHLSIRFTHSTAFESFSVLGVTITGNTTSTRGYR